MPLPVEIVEIDLISLYCKGLCRPRALRLARLRGPASSLHQNSPSQSSLLPGLGSRPLIVVPVWGQSEAPSRPPRRERYSIVESKLADEFRSFS